MKTNRKAIALIKYYEGFRSEKYLDSAGHWTIGYGHLIQDEEELECVTLAQAETLLKADCAFAERAINEEVKTALNSNQYSALVSWVFNLGRGRLRESTMLIRLNDGLLEKVPSEMMRWVSAGGRPLAGLIRRRAAEAQLFIA